MRIGVFICQAGIAETEAVNLEAVRLYASNLPDVETVEVLGLMPKLDPQAVAKRITESRLDRLVIAGDSPGFFKPAFTRAMNLAGGQPDEVRLASFRQYGADAANPTERAKAIVACAVYGVPFSLAAVPADDEDAPGDVIGGGIAGIQAPRDRRRRQEGLPGRAHRDDRRPHGDVRQDVPRHSTAPRAS
jgi:heterodisulfide reductase subunit A